MDDHSLSRLTRHLVFDDRQMQMERELSKENVVHGYHIYKEVWRPVIGKKKNTYCLGSTQICHESMRLMGGVCSTTKCA